MELEIRGLSILGDLSKTKTEESREKKLLIQLIQTSFMVMNKLL